MIYAYIYAYTSENTQILVYSLSHNLMNIAIFTDLFNVANLFSGYKNSEMEYRTLFVVTAYIHNMDIFL